MANATYEICVDWDNNGNFTGTYDDITADVKSISFSRGKSDELGKAEVGQCSITVNNSDGKYTPGYGGVISALLLPKRPIRVRATYSAVTYNLFYGYIEEIIPHPHLSEQDCIITAIDGLDFLSRHDLGTILVKDQNTGYLHKQILYDAGWPNSGIVTDSLALNVPLWQYDLNASPFLSKDTYQHSCTVTGATWSNAGRSFAIAHTDVISIPDSTLWNIGASDFTIIVWAKHSELGVVHHYISQGVSNSYYWLFRKQADNTIIFIYKNGGDTTADRVNVFGTNTLSVDTFYQLAVTRIGTTYQLYINAAPEPSPVTQAHSNSDFAHTLEIGDMTWIGNQGIYGVIGEVQLYLGKGLTQAEILHNYNATKWFYETNIDTGQDTVPYWYGSDVKARFAQGEIDDSEQGFSIVDGAGNFRFEDRYHRSTATHQTSQGTFDNTMAYITYSLNPKNVYNIVKATVTPWELQAIAELWRLEETPSIDIGNTLTWWGEASVSGASVFVEAWTTPVSTTDYTANSQSDGGGTDMTSDISIVTTKFAKSIKLVITNNGTVPAYITLLKARGTYYNPNTKVTRKAEDSTSQTAYQKRTLPFDGKYMSDADQAQDLADYAIGKYKDPRAELSMTLQNQDAATLIQILSREISDRITAVNTKLGVNADYFIDYMQHDISISGLWHTVTYRLADCVNEDFWCLDYSALAEFSTSGQTKLGY